MIQTTTRSTFSKYSIVAVISFVLVAALSQLGHAKIGAFLNDRDADASTPITKSGLNPSIRHARTAEEILIKLQRRHYEKRAFDDELSSRLFDDYLSRLDPSKTYFLQADINLFEEFRFTLDDGIRRGNLKPAFAMFNHYQETAIQQVESLVADLQQRITQLNFEIDESIALDVEELAWSVDSQQRADRQRQNLKNTVLSLKLDEKTNEEIVTTLTKRYSNQLNRLNQFNAEDVFQLYMNTLMSLYDPHSSYMSPRTSENFSINMSLSLEGIGAVLSTEDQYTVVQRLVKGGPAELQGDLKPNDKIVSVAQGTAIEFEDVVGWRLDEVVQLIRGKKGTSVRLKILSGEASATADKKEITIVRNEVKLEDQAAQKELLKVIHNDQLRKVGVIQVPTFYHDYQGEARGDKNFRSTTKDVKRLLNELETQGVEGIIVDLRGNGGGYLEEAKTLTGLFVERGPVVQIRAANGKIQPAFNYPNSDYYKKPIVVLIDRLSASASEIFAGAIQDYRRGLVIGSRSFGKGTVQQVSSLNHGAIKLTEAKYYRISGNSTQNRGIMPDIHFPSLYDNDEIGESALDNALPWDTIKAMDHRTYGDHDAITPLLRERHLARANQDPDYKFLNEQIALNEKYDDLKTLSLNHKVREAMIKQDEAARKALENTRRIGKGLPAISEDQQAKNDSENTDTSSTETPNSKDSDEENKEKDPRTNFELYESAQILLDSIDLIHGEPSNKKSLTAHAG